MAQVLAESVGDDFVHIDGDAQSLALLRSSFLVGGFAFSTIEISTSTAASAFAQITATACTRMP